MIYISNSQANIDDLFEEPAKIQGKGWDKPVDLMKRRYYMREYRKRTNFASDKRYRQSDKGKAARWRYYLKSGK